MIETFLATILLCGAAGEVGEGKCIFVEDKRGPSHSLQACHIRLDDLWTRIQNDSQFIVETTKAVGPFKIKSYVAHRGFCFDPNLGSQLEQVEKRYGL